MKCHGATIRALFSEALWGGPPAEGPAGGGARRGAWAPAEGPGGRPPAEGPPPPPWGPGVEGGEPQKTMQSPDRLYKATKRLYKDIKI